MNNSKDIINKIRIYIYFFPLTSTNSIIFLLFWCHALFPSTLSDNKCDMCKTRPPINYPPPISGTYSATGKIENGAARRYQSAVNLSEKFCKRDISSRQDRNRARQRPYLFASGWLKFAIRTRRSYFCLFPLGGIPAAFDPFQLPKVI